MEQNISNSFYIDKEGMKKHNLVTLADLRNWEKETGICFSNFYFHDDTKFNKLDDEALLFYNLLVNYNFDDSNDRILFFINHSKNDIEKLLAKIIICVGQETIQTLPFFTNFDCFINKLYDDENVINIFAKLPNHYFNKYYIASFLHDFYDSFLYKIINYCLDDNIEIKIKMQEMWLISSNKELIIDVLNFFENLKTKNPKYFGTEIMFSERSKNIFNTGLFFKRFKLSINGNLITDQDLDFEKALQIYNDLCEEKNEK